MSNLDPSMTLRSAAKTLLVLVLALPVAQIVLIWVRGLLNSMGDAAGSAIPVNAIKIPINHALIQPPINYVDQPLRSFTHVRDSNQSDSSIVVSAESLHQTDIAE